MASALSRCPPAAAAQVTPFMGSSRVALFVGRCAGGTGIESSRLTRTDLTLNDDLEGVRALIWRSSVDAWGAS
jgi:hypothetical protein